MIIEVLILFLVLLIINIIFRKKIIDIRLAVDEFELYINDDFYLDENIIKFMSCEYVAAAAGLVGSGGREIWSFRAVCPGKANIAFKYFRPWEKDVPPAKSLTFNVAVKEPSKARSKQEDRCSDQR